MHQKKCSAFSRQTVPTAQTLLQKRSVGPLSVHPPGGQHGPTGEVGKCVTVQHGEPLQTLPLHGNAVLAELRGLRPWPVWPHCFGHGSTARGEAVHPPPEARQCRDPKPTQKVKVKRVCLLNRGNRHSSSKDSILSQNRSLNKLVSKWICVQASTLRRGIQNKNR